MTIPRKPGRRGRVAPDELVRRRKRRAAKESADDGLAFTLSPEVTPHDSHDPAQLEMDDGRADDDGGVNVILEQLGDAVAAVQLRRQTASGEWAFIGRVERDDAVEEHIQEMYGGGRYRARVFDRDNRFMKQVTFRIDGPPKRLPVPEAPIRETANGGLDPATEQRLGRIEHAMMEMLRAQQAKPSGDSSGGVLMQLLTIAMPAIVAKITAPPATDPLMQTLITALLAKKDEGGAADIIKMLKEAERDGYERAVELGERGGDPFGTALAAALPKAVDALAASAQTDRARIAAAAPVATVQAAAPKTLTSGAQDVNIPGVPAWALQLRRLVPTFCKLADAGKNPSVRALVLLDEMKPDDVAAMGDVAKQYDEDAFVAMALSLAPDLTSTPKRAEWAGEFIGTLWDELVPDEDGDEGDEDDDGETDEDGEPMARVTAVPETIAGPATGAQIREAVADFREKMPKKPKKPKKPKPDPNALPDESRSDIEARS